MPEEEDFERTVNEMRDAMAARPLKERVELWWFWHGNQLVQQLEHFKDGKYDLVTVLEQVLLQDRKLKKLGAAYAIEEGEAEALFAGAEKDWVYHKLVSRICAANIRSGRPLPKILQLFSAARILGNLDEPKQRGRKSNKTWVRNLLLVRAIRGAKVLSIYPTRNEVTSDDVPCGCSLASEALDRAGLDPLDWETVKREIWQKRKEYEVIDEKLQLYAFSEAVRGQD